MAKRALQQAPAVSMLYVLKEKKGKVSKPLKNPPLTSDFNYSVADFSLIRFIAPKRSYWIYFIVIATSVFLLESLGLEFFLVGALLVILFTIHGFTEAVLALQQGILERLIRVEKRAFAIEKKLKINSVEEHYLEREYDDWLFNKIQERLSKGEE